MSKTDKRYVRFSIIFSVSNFMKSRASGSNSYSSWRTRTLEPHREIEVNWNVYGFALELKGHPGTQTPTITLNTHGEPNSIMINLGTRNPTDKWIFSAQHNSIETADGTVM
jgi:hypothetical protein